MGIQGKWTLRHEGARGGWRGEGAQNMGQPGPADTVHRRKMKDSYEGYIRLPVRRRKGSGNPSMLAKSSRRSRSPGAPSW